MGRESGAELGRDRGSPNLVPGVRLYFQAHALDTNSSYAVKVANSHGSVLDVPPISPGMLQPVTRLHNQTPSIGEAKFLGTSNVGYGLVTEFTY
jgi:hypothetical protein